MFLSLLSRPLTEIPDVSFVADIFSHEQEDFFCFIKIGRSENHEIDTLWILFPVLTQLEFSNWILTFEVWCRTFVQNLETELREDISHFYLQSLTLPISKIWHTGIYKSGATNIRYMYVENLFIFVSIYFKIYMETDH